MMNKLIPLAITSKDTINAELIKKASESLSKFLEDTEEPPFYKELFEKGYVYCTTADDETFLIEKSETIKAKSGENGYLFFPKVFKDSKKLETIFDIVRTNEGEYYESSSEEIVKPKNCRTFYLKKNCYKCHYSNVYFKNKDDVIPNIEGLEYVDKSLVVMTVDTGEYKIKNNCYYYSPERVYYRYRQLAPDYRENGEPFWFDETKKRDLKERAVGIELEYENAGHLCYEVLKNKDLREFWSTTHDGSLSSKGAEFISVPFKLTELHKVKELINLAKQVGVVADKRCGYHVHISGKDLNYMDISSLINLCMSVQGPMFNLVADERMDNRYCRMLDGRFLGFSKVKNKNDRIKAGKHYYQDEKLFRERHKKSKYSVNEARHYWLNIDRMYRFRNKENSHQKTIEFRLYQADFDVEMFEKMILLFYYMVEYAKNHSQKTCSISTLQQVANFAPYNHRKLINQIIK